MSGDHEADALDPAALDRWLTEHVAGYAGPLTLRRLQGGQSNPTYELITPGRAYVLRMKPPGRLLPSAHAVDREFRVISALHPVGYPVARPWALCEDEGVIGRIFYIMDRVEGRVFWDLKLPGLAPDQRTAIYRAQTAALARLHALHVEAMGLADYGRPTGYFARQVGRWSKQYAASETRKIPAMDRLMAFLPDSLPPERPAALVHGDWRLDNMIFAPDGPEIRAVLDWELSTLGDPTADLGYFLMAWVIPASQRNGLAGADLKALGIPSLEETAARYAEASGAPPVANLDWLFAYNLFRLAAICQGIAGRVRDGAAAGRDAPAMAAQAEPLAEAAWRFALKAGA